MTLCPNSAQSDANRHHPHHRWVIRLNQHRFLIMKLPWSRFTPATYKITWTSHVELHLQDQLILTTYLRSLKHFNQSIWTGTFLACFHYVPITIRTYNSKHTVMCHIKRLSIKLIDQLNIKTMHFYILPFALDTLQKANSNMPFSQTLLSIWRTTTYAQMSNIKTLSLLKLSTIYFSILYCFISYSEL